MSRQLTDSVRRAIESSVKPGCRMRTPDWVRGSYFFVNSVGENDIRVDKIPQTPITWKELGDVVSWLKSRRLSCGERGYTCEIGSTQAVERRRTLSNGAYENSLV